MDRLYREETERLRAAIPSSINEAGISMGKVYRARADTSERDEEQFLDKAVAEAREMSPSCLTAETEEAAFEEEEEEGRRGRSRDRRGNRRGGGGDRRQERTRETVLDHQPNHHQNSPRREKERK